MAKTDFNRALQYFYMAERNPTIQTIQKILGEIEKAKFPISRNEIWKRTNADWSSLKRGLEYLVLKNEIQEIQTENNFYYTAVLK
jgi:hypothetical protein